MDDLPTISALRDEESPPPDKTSFARFRIKLPKKSAPDAIRDDTELPKPTDTDPWPNRTESKQADEDELEEDQLIDDDDMSTAATATPGPSSSKTSGVSPTKKSPKKPRARKSAVKKQEADQQLFMVSTFEFAPNVATNVQTTEESWAPVQTYVPTAAAAKAKPAKRRSAATKKEKEKPATGVARPKKTKVSKSSAMQQHMDDAASSVSETNPNTAPSSPMIFEVDNPDYENIPNLPPLPPIASARDSVIDPEVEPVPIWPIPTRNFSVLPAPKVPTGNAPVQPPEKNTPPVRAWRQAQREIKGIGGGRWFVQSWIGAKDSSYGDYKGSQAASGTPAGTTTAVGKKLKFLKPDLAGDRSTLASGASTPAPLIQEIAIT